MTTLQQNNEKKLRILHLYLKLLEDTSCAEDALSTKQLSDWLLEEKGMYVSRNTISDDLEVLSGSDLNIAVERSTQNRYHYTGRQLTTEEIKLLYDAVAASKFIGKQQSSQLGYKLLSLLPPDIQDDIRYRIEEVALTKPENSQSYRIVEVLRRAIRDGKQIQFTYLDYDMKKRPFEVNGGEPYIVSPYTTLWDSDYYYLRCYCHNANAMRTFRVDRIAHVPLILDAPAIPAPDDYDLAQFRKASFRMFGNGTPEKVTLRCESYLMKTIIDNWGTDIDPWPQNDHSFTVEVTVYPSPIFFRWVFGFGGDVDILKPSSVRENYKSLVQKVWDNLNDDKS